MTGIDVGGDSERLLPDVNRLRDLGTGIATRAEHLKAFEDEDWGTFERTAVEQRRQAGMATIEVLRSGGDPRYQTAPIGAAVDPRIEVERRILEMRRKSQEIDSVLEQGGFGEIQKFMSEVAEQYKAKNSQLLIKQPKDENEYVELVKQLQPAVIDPNRVAAVRQMAVKLDQQMKVSDPTTSFWTNPKTKEIAQWINREAGEGGVGYFRSGEQKLQTGVMGTAAIGALELVEGASDFGLHAIHGAWNLADRGLRALGLPSVDPPRNYVVGPDGQLYVDKSKVPGFGDAMSMLFAHVTDKNIQNTVEEFQRAREQEAAERNGFRNVALGASRVIGMGVGFGLPAGMAMNAGAKAFGNLTTKGLGFLGSAGLKGAASERALKVTQMLGATFGAAAANGAAESLAYGEQDGYGAAFGHGMAMAPVLMAFGWMGKRTEHWLTQRQKMPKRMAAAISGAIEGVGFGALEAAELGSLWDFVKDPNQTTFETYAKNIVGMLLFKALGPQGPAATMAQMEAARTREGFARKVAEGRASEEEVAALGGKAEDIRKLGETSLAVPTTFREVMAKKEVKGEIERRLDVQEMELGPKQETEMRKVEEEGGEISLKAPEKSGLRRLFEEKFKGVGKISEEYTPTFGDKPQSEKSKAQEGAKSFPELMKIEREYVTAREKSEMPVSAQERKAAESKRRETKEELEAKERQKFEQERTSEGNPEWQIAAKERIRGEIRALDEFILGELQQKRRQLMREHGVSKLTGARDVEALERVDQRIAKLEEKLGRRPRPAEGERRGRPQAVEPGIIEEPGPRTSTPEMFEAWAAKMEKENPGKAADLRRRAEALRAASQPAEAPRTEPGGDLGPAKPSGETEYRHLPAGERKGPGSFQHPPTRQLEPSAGVRPTRAMDIIAEMEGRPARSGWRVPFTTRRFGAREGDPVRTPIRFGRVRRGAEGLFKFFENLTRIKEGRDLVVASHEWSHALSRHALAERGGVAFKDALEDWFNSYPGIFGDVVSILKDYPGANRLTTWQAAAEAWAEWHARNLLGDDSIFTSYPNLSRVMQDFLRAPENAAIRSQYQRIQSMLHNYNVQGAIARVRMSRTSATEIATETEKETAERTPIQRAVDAINKAMFDDAADLKLGSEKHLRSVGRNPDEVNILDNPGRMYDALRMSAAKKVALWIKEGFDSPAGKVSSLESIIGKVKGNEENFTDYLVAVRNAELLKQGKSALLPLRDYAYAVQQHQRANPEFRSVARELKTWTDSVVDYVSESGAISKESAQRIKDSYVVYLPFFREIEGPRPQAGGRGVAERGSGLMQIEGFGAEIRDPMMALKDVATTLVSRAHQHMVMTALYRMAQAHELGGLATVVERDRVPHDHPVASVIDALQKKAGDESLDPLFETLRDSLGSDPGVVTLFSQKVIPTGTRAILAFTPRLTAEDINRISRDHEHRAILEKQNENLQWLEVDTKVYETLMGIDAKPSMGWLDIPVLREILRFPAAVTRFFATGVNIGFTVANIPRDILSYSVFSKKGEFRPLSGFSQWVKGLSLYVDKTGQFRRMYEELGVRTSSFYSEGRMRNLLGQHGSTMKKSLLTVSKVVDQAKSLLEAPENFLRIAEFADVYNKAKSEGASEQEARMRALEAGREITVNFARAGTVSRILNQMIPYFNPGLQGQRKTWRALAGREGATDAERARLQRAAFANGIVSITVPSLFLWWMNKDEDWYQDLPKWRKSMYWNFKLWGEIVSIPKPFELGVMFGSVPETIADGMHEKGEPVDVGTILRNSILGYMDGPAALIPAFIRPLIEGEFNYQSFYNRALTPEWIAKSKIPSEQATAYTTEIAKVLSRSVGGLLTPIEIEHYLGSYTAGATTSVMRAADELLGLKNHPGWSANPVNRFFSQEPHGQSRMVDKLYDLSVRLDQLEGSDLMTPSERQVQSQVDAAKRAISDLRKAHQKGKISRDEANRRAYEIARPIIRKSELVK